MSIIVWRASGQEDHIVGVEQAVDQLLANLYPDTKGLETHDELVDETVE